MRPTSGGAGKRWLPVRRRPSAQPVAPRAGVVVPPELACGPMLEVWGDPAGATEGEWGPMGALIAARGRFSRARTAWEKAEGLDVRTSCQLVPPGRPWSLSEDEATDRLARLGLSEADVPHLRAAAQALVATSDPATRRRV